MSYVPVVQLAAGARSSYLHRGANNSTCRGTRLSLDGCTPPSTSTGSTATRPHLDQYGVEGYQAAP